MHAAFNGGLPAQTAPLLCGLIASFLKVATDVLAGLRWKSYSFSAQSISDLSAIGAPTRRMVLALDLAYDALMIVFGIGLWQASGPSLLLRVAAALVIANPLLSAAVSLHRPMRLGEKPAPSHVVPMAIAMFCFLFAMLLGGLGRSGWFRIFSIAILLAYLALAVVRLRVPARAVDTRPTATIGAQERTMVAGYLLWVAALAIIEVAKAAG